MTGKDPDKTKALSAFIAERLKALGISAAEASIRTGMNRDAIRDIYRGSAPGHDKLRALAQVLGVSADDLLTLATESRKPSHSAVDVPPFARFHTGPSDLSLKRFMMNADGSFSDNTVTSVTRPSELIGRPEGYAVYVADDLNAPFFRTGHIAYIDPSRPVAVGHLVRVTPSGGAPYIGTLDSLSPEWALVRIASEPTPRRHASETIHKIERVVAVSLIDA